MLFTKVATMSDMKCPFCNGEMAGTIGHPICHYNPDCPIHDETVPVEVLELLDRTRKALDVAVDALKRTDWCAQDYAIAQEALNKITALEQKDK